MSASLCALLACDDAPRTAPSAPSPPAPPPSAAAPVPVDPRIPSSVVETFIDRWRTAQVRADFVAYEGLYHPTFQGTKRVGERSRTLDRTAWLADRRELFQRDVTVVVRDLHVFTGEKSAFVTFEQEWSTPSFRDVGPKRIEMVWQGGELSITREEMIASSAASVDGARKAPAPEELSLILSLRGRPAAVLAVGSIDTVGRARRIGPRDDLDHWFEKDVSASIEQRWSQWKGRRMHLYKEGALACTGTVTGLRAVAGIFGSDEVKLDTPAERKADEAWEWLSDSAKHLVALIEPETGPCVADWARAADLPPPHVLERRGLEAREQVTARGLLAKTPLAREAQRMHDAFVADPRHSSEAAGAPPSWLDVPGGESGEWAFVDSGTGAVYFALERLTGEFCAGPGGYAMGFFKESTPAWIDVTGNGDPRLSFPIRPRAGALPHTAVVLHPGQRPVMISRFALYTEGREGFVPVIAVGQERTICSC